MPTFKNIGDEVTAYKPAGDPAAVLVAHGKTIDVAGELITSQHEPKDGELVESLPADAYIVRDARGEERAWPHAQWEMVPDKTAAKTAAKES